MRVLDKSSVVLGFDSLGFDEDLLKTYEQYLHQALRDHSGDRTDRLRKVDHALHHADRAQYTREEHHHGRGPGRAPLKGVNQVQLNLKAGLNFASALKSILRSTLTSSWWARSGPGDGCHRHRGRPHRPHGAGHASHQQCGVHADAADRDGHRALSGHLVAFRSPGPAAGPTLVCTAKRRTSPPRPTSWPRDGRRMKSMQKGRFPRCTGPSAARRAPTPDIEGARHWPN